MWSLCLDMLVCLKSKMCLFEKNNGNGLHFLHCDFSILALWFSHLCIVILYFVRCYFPISALLFSHIDVVIFPFVFLTMTMGKHQCFPIRPWQCTMWKSQRENAPCTMKMEMFNEKRLALTHLASELVKHISTAKLAV